MESGTVARQNYSVQSRADGEKVVKTNEKTLGEVASGRRRGNTPDAVERGRESGKQ